MQNYTLEATLALLKEGKELNRKLLVIKDAAEQLKLDGQHKSDKVIALLKEIARKIRKGDIDATVIIVSPTLHIPQELEKLITVLELDLPDETEISQIINQFAEENEISSGPADFRGELATAFKGLSESEIKDILSLAVSQDGELTKKALKLIFDQKQQMILKAGILEMVPLKESISDIGGLEVLKEWLHKKAAVFKDMKAAEEFGVTLPNLALGTARRSWSTIHIGDLAAKMDEAHNTLLLAEKYMGRLGMEFSRLSKIKLSDQKVMEYIDLLLPMDEQPTDIHRKNITRIREDMKRRYFDAPDLRHVGKNAYRFINAVSDYATHAKPLRETANYREKVLAKTVEGNPLIDKAYELVLAA